MSADLAAGGPGPHACRWVARRPWSDWAAAGGTLEERFRTRAPVCEICGRVRPARRPRPPIEREVRAVRPAAPPLADPFGRLVAAEIARRGPEPGVPVFAAGLLGALARQGLPASLAEGWIERFLEAGWLTATWSQGTLPRLLELTPRNPDALRELARPGAAELRRNALAAARARLAGLALSHPKAREAAALLAGEEAESWPPAAVAAVAALAVHADTGEVLAERVFSARHLGDSKALGRLRGRLERRLGPLDALGIREGAAVTLLGGRGTLRLRGRELDLGALAPFAGLAREAMADLVEVGFPESGLLVVENLTVFEACCRGEVEGAAGTLVVWSGGYPGPAVWRFVERAAAARVPVRVWADLDLDGVRIARLVLSWAAAGEPGSARPWRMGPEDLAGLPATLPLSARAAAAIRRDLEERPDAPLAETLRALLEVGRWAEQEAFLGG